ncbi:hypothetical protein BJY52DRAFT_1194324 [Lactarius psammicola]|nr:hypothetical protein BJY52DRAFT_1194324 [Lactarius psammicola]
MSMTSSGYQVVGQITAYATMVMSTQFRTHSFLVLVFKNFARLIRWDRGGAVVIAPIYYDNEPHLLDFFVRYDHATPEICGHDSTVGPPTKDEDRDARTLGDLADAKSLLAITIVDPIHHQQSSRYIIRGPYAQPDIPAGRWTRTSIAYDVRRKKRVLLKDSWRVLLEDITPEGEVYATLRQHSVPNIPLCSYAGDVGDGNYHKSRTHEFVSKCRGSMQLTPHRHYRLVLDTIGRKLENFSRSWELVNAIHASLVAHEAACKVGVLHCDISVGNIMIVDDDEPNIKGGILIDWDLSKVINPPEERSMARQYTRTGTWQFMAADLVQRSSIPHAFVHDLESVFWVMFWIVISYMPSSWNEADRTSFLQETMSPRVYHNSGGRSKLFFMQTEDPIPGFSLDQNSILFDLLVSLKKTLAVRHRQLPARPSKLDPLNIKAKMDGSGTLGSPVALQDKVQEYNMLIACLEDHEVILRMLSDALNTPGWPNNDAADPQPLLMSREVGRSGSKRSRLVAEGNGVFVSLPAGKRSEVA